MMSHKNFQEWHFFLSKRWRSFFFFKHICPSTKIKFSTMQNVNCSNCQATLIPPYKWDIVTKLWNSPFLYYKPRNRRFKYFVLDVLQNLFLNWIINLLFMREQQKGIQINDTELIILICIKLSVFNFQWKPNETIVPIWIH